MDAQTHMPAGGGIKMTTPDHWSEAPERAYADTAGEPPHGSYEADVAHAPVDPGASLAAASSAGGVMDAGSLMEEVIAALRTVHDPEIPVNIYDLGLIYKIDLAPVANVEIDMTLTAPGCPVASEIVTWVQNAVNAVAGIGAVKVNLVFDPPWDTSRMSDEVKLELGLL